MGLKQIRYTQTYNQGGTREQLPVKEKRERSVLSALGFTIGGRPHDPDDGGGDKNTLTDIGMRITFLGLHSRSGK